MEEDDWQNWTSCEMYGHHFLDGRCVDCQEEAEPDEDPS